MWNKYLTLLKLCVGSSFSMVLSLNYFGGRWPDFCQTPRYNPFSFLLTSWISCKIQSCFHCWYVSWAVVASFLPVSVEHIDVITRHSDEWPDSNQDIYFFLNRLCLLSKVLPTLGRKIVNYVGRSSSYTADKIVLTSEFLTPGFLKTNVWFWIYFHFTFEADNISASRV